MEHRTRKRVRRHKATGCFTSLLSQNFGHPPRQRRSAHTAPVVRGTDGLLELDYVDPPTI